MIRYFATVSVQLGYIGIVLALLGQTGWTWGLKWQVLLFSLYCCHPTTRNCQSFKAIVSDLKANILAMENKISGQDIHVAESSLHSHVTRSRQSNANNLTKSEPPLRADSRPSLNGSVRLVSTPSPQHDKKWSSEKYMYMYEDFPILSHGEIRHWLQRDIHQPTPCADSSSLCLQPQVLSLLQEPQLQMNQSIWPR